MISWVKNSSTYKWNVGEEPLHTNEWKISEDYLKLNDRYNLMLESKVWLLDSYVKIENATNITLGV